ncbi:hypothetical protein OSTOST_09863 [Ostertagia ostertagi]
MDVFVHNSPQGKQLLTEKEKEFQEKCESMKESIQEKVEKARAQAKRELDYMEERVKLCKPLLATGAKYSVHRNVDTRRWVHGFDERTQMPPDRRMCDQATWELVQRYASNCEKLASQITIGKRKKQH